MPGNSKFVEHSKKKKFLSKENHLIKVEKTFDKINTHSWLNKKTLNKLKIGKLPQSS